MAATEPVLLASLISSGSAIVLALIARLRWRCMPDKDGKCICQSGCSEVPLTDAQEEVICHEYDLNGQKVLLVSSHGEKG